MIKPFISLLLVMIMSLPLVACGAKVTYTFTDLPGTDKTYNAMDLEFDLELSEGEEYIISDMYATEDRIYTYGILTGEKGEERYTRCKYIVFDYKGRVQSERTFEEGESYNRVQFLADGSSIYIDQNVTGNSDVQTAEGSYPYELVYCDAAGKELKRIFLYEERADNISEGYTWSDSIGRIVPGADKHVYILYRDQNYLDDVDLQAGTVTQIEMPDTVVDVWKNFRFFMDGQPVVEQKDRMNKRYYQTVDVSTGAVGEIFSLLDVDVALPPDMTDTIGVGLYFYDGAGSEYDLVLPYESGIYGFNRGDDTYTRIVEEGECALSEHSVEDICFVEEDRFVVLYRGINVEEKHLVVFEGQ